MKQGIDISKWQGNIDTKKIKESGLVDFVILREGHFQTVDPKFFEYVKQFKEVGIPIIGIYHFSYALTVEQAINSATFAISNLKKADLDKDTMVFYDFEYDTITKAASKGVTLSKDDCNTFTVAFCEAVKNLGYKPGVYTNLDFYKNTYIQAVKDSYPIWLADYKGEPDFPCLIQQYSSKGSIPGIKGNVDMNYYFGEIQNQDKNLRSRQEVVDLARSWLGKNETDGSFKEIIDIYNSYNPKPRGVTMTYTMSWCACTWSAIAIKLGFTDIMPIEVSCGELIKRAQSMGIWIEDDGYEPLPGDGILYDWDDNGIGDNTGWPDHIGIVEEILADTMVIIEGNKNDTVSRRVVKVNDKFIRGFICPKYDKSSDTTEITVIIKSDRTIAEEVIAGKWGSGVERKRNIEAYGYNYNKVQTMVNLILKEKPSQMKNLKDSLTFLSKGLEYTDDEIINMVLDML